MIADPQDDEFFIGYASPMPPRLSQFVRGVVVALGGFVMIWAGVAGAGHVRLAGGTFEFGRPMDFTGAIAVQPYPTVSLDRPDGTGGPLPLLVAPGKHGADALVARFDGQRVGFRGTRIRRGPFLMIEIDPSSVAAEKSPPQVEAPSRSGDGGPSEDSIRTISVTGEVVDTKCFLGVMVPGAGKTHKDCASLCLRGGIPPALSVRNRAGELSLLLLTGPAGQRISSTVVEAAGESIAVTGDLHRLGGWLVLRTDPVSWRPATR